MTSRNWITFLSGPGLVLAYCFINAVKSVFEGALVQAISPEFLAFNCFLLAQAFYFAICRDRRRLWSIIRHHAGDVLALNVSTMLSWVAVLYALKSFEPAVANSIIVGVIPIITIVMGRWLRPGGGVNALEVVASLGVLAAMAYLTDATWSGASAMGRMSPQAFAIGLTACLLTAAAVCGNTFFTKRLSEKGMTAAQIMTCRFPLLLVATLVVFIWRDSAAPYTADNILAFVLLGAIGVIFAIYVLQVGITRSEPITVSLLFASNLIMTFVIQLFDPRLEHAPTTLAGILALSAFVALGGWARYRSKPKLVVEEGA